MFQKWEKTLRYSLIKKLKLQVQLVPKGLIVGQSSVTLMVGFTLQLTKGEQLALFLYGEGEIEGWMGGCTLKNSLISHIPYLYFLFVKKFLLTHHHKH